MKLFAGKKNDFWRFSGICFLVSGCMVLIQPLAALADRSAHHVDEKRFFSKVKKTVHRRGGLGTVQFQTYKQIINYWNAHPAMNDRRWLAYVMATAYHETRLKPVREGYAKTDAGARKIVNRMWRQRRITLPYHRPDRVTGHVYYGRGYVQLTWAENYKKMGRAIGMGDKLYRNPDLVLDPEIASKILFVGMLKGKFRYSRRTHPKGPQKLKLFFNNKSSNWYRARNIINGDLRKNGNRIAGYGRKYANAISLMKAPDEPIVTDDGSEPKEGEVVPSLPGTQVADAGAPIQPETPVPTSEPVGEPSSGETPSVAEPGPAETSETPEPSETPVDTEGEVVPSLPEAGDIVADSPLVPAVTDIVTPETAEPSEVALGEETEIVPIPIEHPVLVEQPSDGETVAETPPVQAGDEIAQQGEASEGIPIPIEHPSAGDAIGQSGDVANPIEDKGWWGSIKSFFAKYKGYVWKD